MPQTDIAIAIVSILLYSLLAAVSAYYFLKFRHILKMKSSMPHCDFGRYDEPKILFFLVLCISATLDIPMYVGCLAEGGPKDCEWDSVTYPIFWSMHLLALCGYLFSIVTPPVLWSDIINQKDGKLWFSKYPMDGTKWFFQISLFLFWFLMVMTVVLVILFYRVNDHNKFTKSNVRNAISSILEPTLTFMISAGCLYCGLRLQLYVMKVRLEGAKEIRFLFHLNVTLLIILATYLSRSLMVLRLFVWMSEPYREAFKCSYFVWILVTRWLPYIFCSFCLINEMRFTGTQIADKYNRTASTVLNSTTNSLLKSSSSHSLLFSADSMSLSQMQGSANDDDHSGSNLTRSLIDNASDAGSARQYSLLRESYGEYDNSYLMSSSAPSAFDDPFDLREFMEEQQHMLQSENLLEAGQKTHSSSEESPRGSQQVDHFQPGSYKSSDDHMFSADTSF